MIRRTVLLQPHLLMLALLAPLSAHAQYLEPGMRPAEISRFFSAGASFRQFVPRSGHPLGPDAISYHAVMPTLGLRQGPVEFLAAYGRYEREGESHEAILAAATFAMEFPLAGGPRYPLRGLVLLTTDYTKSEAPGPGREAFNVASLGVGAGMAYRTSGRSVQVALSAAASAQYSFEGFRTGSGFSPLLMGDAVVALPGVPVLDGLVAGYRLRWQQWSMSDDRLRYRSLFHGPWLGVSF